MIVSRETSERLEIYEALLQKWTARINLIAPGTLHDLRRRHIEDCMQLVDLSGDVRGRWVDLGSGGGLPGLVLAIVHAGAGAEFILVESDRRKAAFLRTVIRETGLDNATVLAERIEVLAPLNAAYVSARALAPLGELMRYLYQHLDSNGRAYLMKGRRWQSELEEARREWIFDCIAHPSRTDEGAAILEISGVTRGTS